ncbi:MAG TPA: hypothetical protein VK358_09990 [Longimicrobium sp.]|nr:hypothetical protein [Longimicrobium sp.]
MSINPYPALRTLVAGAALCVLAGCEAARVAQPRPAPSPAENVAAAAAAIGLPPSAVAGQTATLAQHAQGWDVPAAPAKADATLDPATAREMTERAARLERGLRAYVEESKAPR